MSHIGGSIRIKENDKLFRKSPSIYQQLRETTFILEGAFSAICLLIVGDAVWCAEMSASAPSDKLVLL